MPAYEEPVRDLDPGVILDSLPEGVLVLDVAGIIRLWNRTLTALTGHSAEEALGQPVALLGSQQDSVLSGGAAAAGVPPSDPVLCAVRTRHGETRSVLRSCRQLQDAAGVWTGTVVSFVDARLLPAPRPGPALPSSDADPDRFGIGRLVGDSTTMRRLYGRIRLAANADVTVLVLGETGTGKELVAEAMHSGSHRHAGPFIKVNCSALPETLLESELFGHVRGAFTGAVRDKAGRFELADHGTLFLDEIGEISPLVQLKLLRVLQEHEFERVGESRTRSSDVRVVAATNRDLRAQVAAGAFREDLYYRLRVFTLTVPPLRERKEDIPRLVEHFMRRFRRSTGKRITKISAEVTYCLMDCCWPGNVRELENAVEHAFVTCQGAEIGLFDLPSEIRRVEFRAAECAERTRPVGGALPARSRSACRRADLLAALERNDWNKAAAARDLGVTRTTVWRKMKQWQIQLQPAPRRAAGSSGEGA